MKRRPYYSMRTGKNPDAIGFDLTMLKRLFREVYLSFEDRCYFQQAFGFFCVDRGDVPGELGSDIAAQVFLALRKTDLWPMADNLDSYSEDDLFDMIEFLYDCVSKPVDGFYHDFSDCGWHYSEFDESAGREGFRQAINELLKDYEQKYELSEEGEILSLGDEGLESLLEADLPEFDPDNVEGRVGAAKRKFRRYHSSMGDRRDAVRDLADVLEFLRPKAAECLLTKKDENDLFQIANKFAIRHHNGRQKGDYSITIWYSWIFYVYLATIHAAVRVIKQSGSRDIQTP